MASSNKQRTDAEKKLDGDIAKMDLYGLFDVDPEATEKAILKAYRKKALKCHPDKNPDNPKAAEVFHTLSMALEILTDVPARVAYDKMLKAKKAAELRHTVLDSKRKKFKEDLEAREKRAHEDKTTQNIVPQLSQAEKLQKEIDRLRKEGSRMLEEEQERMKQEIQAEKQQSKASSTEEPPRLKLKWRAEKGDLQNGGYSDEKLHEIFDIYGQISALIVSRKKLGSAIVEFAQPGAAALAHDNETGLRGNPINISWLSGKPENSRDFSASLFETPQVNHDLLSGFSFCTHTFSADSNKPNNEQASERTTHGSADSTKESGSGLDASNDDFESLVLRNLRQAQERKRLEQELLKEEKNDE